jgi:hypothetical protein
MQTCDTGCLSHGVAWSRQEPSVLISMVLPAPEGLLAGHAVLQEKPFATVVRHVCIT